MASGSAVSNTANFGQWKYTPERRATVRAYDQAERGGADTCSCATCRNFRLARARVFSAKFLALLEGLGIDPHKDTEVYYIAQRTPGRHDYGGWYHFVGTLDETGDFPPVDFGDGFTVRMCRASAPRLQVLKDLPVVQVEFHAQAVPWLLDARTNVKCQLCSCRLKAYCGGRDR